MSTARSETSLFELFAAFRLNETSVLQSSKAEQAPGDWTALRDKPLLVIPDAEPLARGDPRTKLPDELRRIWPSAQAQKKYAEARQSEFAFLGEELDALYRQTQANPQPLGSKPLIVLTRDAADYARAPDGMTIEEVNNDRKRLQNELGGLSSNSRIVVVKDSTHEIHLDRPEVVTAAIRDVVEASRIGSLLK